MDKGFGKTHMTVPGLRELTSGKTIYKQIRHRYYRAVSARFEAFTGHKFGTLSKRLLAFPFSS